MKRDYEDFSAKVPERHQAMDARLVNWSLWVSVRPFGWPTQPMFRMFKSNWRQWSMPEYRPTCDILDAQFIEKMVSKLPEKHKTAIRWNYVFGSNPRRVAQTLGVSMQGLNQLISEGMTMLENICKKHCKDI